MTNHFRAPAVSRFPAISLPWPFPRPNAGGAAAFALALALLVLLLLPHAVARAESPNPALRVSVSLAGDLRDQARPDDTLFVYARAPSGPRMPLAIVRLKASDLPAVVTLDESSAMMQNLKLSAFEEVVVMARISRSGDAMPRSGDLLGSTPPVPVKGSSDIRILIDSRLP